MCDNSKEFFFMDEHLKKQSAVDKKDKRKHIKNSVTIDKQARFEKLCKDIKQKFDEDWETEHGKNPEQSDELLEINKNAIIGFTKQVNYYKDKIDEYLTKNGQLNEWFPSWYEDLTTAIFQENWGLAGIAEWKTMPDSSSAKIIGEKIFYLENGKQVLQDQKISNERLRQLRRALLLRNPDKRLSDKYIEVYMLDGTRIIIFDEPLVKEPTIIFRQYIMDTFTFEEQARRGTIPEEAIPLFKAWAKCGYNINIVGGVRTGKTTFLQTWQNYEDDSLEGIQVETDPEVPEHILKPNSPIIQIVADGEELKRIVKMLVRGDADYLIMAEARDGVALYIAVQVANKGTRRVKSTFHTSDVPDFCFDAANEIIKEFGGDLFMTIVKVAKSYHYLPEMIQLKDKSKKRLNAVYEMRYDNEAREITFHRIMKYDIKTDSWTYNYEIGTDKEFIGEQENPEAYHIFRNELKRLSDLYPMADKDKKPIKPYYTQFMRM